jgi:hypothetical protein
LWTSPPSLWWTTRATISSRDGYRIRRGLDVKTSISSP